MLTTHSAKLLFLLQQYPMSILVFQRNVMLAYKIEGGRHMEKIQWYYNDYTNDGKSLHASNFRYLSEDELD
jgi:hypothetical protein